MSATTAQSTEVLASPLSSQARSSWLLSACSPCPRPANPPSAAPVPPSPPPASCRTTTMSRPTRPSPPPPTAMPRPPPSPPPRPRRSWTLDVSRRPPSRYLILRRPLLECSRAEEAVVRRRHGEPDLDRAVHLLAGWREVEVDLAVLEPCHRGDGPRDSEPAAAQPGVAHLQQRGELRAEGRGVLPGPVHGVADGVQPGPLDRRAVGAQPPPWSGHVDVVQPPQLDHQVPDGVQPADGEPGLQRGDRLSRCPAVAHLQVDGRGAGVHRLQRVPRRPCDGGHLRLGGLAALQGRLPVAGAHAD